jgi:hypothetical protein
MLQRRLFPKQALKGKPSGSRQGILRELSELLPGGCEDKPRARLRVSRELSELHPGEAAPAALRLGFESDCARRLADLGLRTVGRYASVPLAAVRGRRPWLFVQTP